MTPFGVMPMPSNERRPTAVRSTTFPVPSQAGGEGGHVTVAGVVVADDIATPVVFNGSTNSNRRPLVPFSSANTIVPQGVLWAGSQLTRPDATIVSTSPS